jgi:hypothetical protein
MALVGRGMPRPEVVASHRVLRQRGRGDATAAAGQALPGHTLLWRRGMGGEE